MFGARAYTFGSFHFCLDVIAARARDIGKKAP
jgi:hypothetical protein